jgi:hypothetical protein
MKEAAAIAYKGVLWAIVLAWAAFVVRGAGLGALPLIAVPLIAAWVLGEQHGYAKGVRDLKKALRP